MLKTNISQKQTPNLANMSQKQLIDYYDSLTKKKENFAELIYPNQENPLLDNFFSEKNHNKMLFPLKKSHHKLKL
ncbi:MAG: hypothetical protein ACR2HS_06295 [Gammaproteobacteria bacterium]